LWVILSEFCHPLTPLEICHGKPTSMDPCSSQNQLGSTPYVYWKFQSSLDWFTGHFIGNSHDLHGKNHGFRWRFSRLNQSNDFSVFLGRVSPTNHLQPAKLPHACWQLGPSQASSQPWARERPCSIPCIPQKLSLSKPYTLVNHGW
jgi:hypothetical protein